MLATTLFLSEDTFFPAGKDCRKYAVSIFIGPHNLMVEQPYFKFPR